MWWQPITENFESILAIWLVILSFYLIKTVGHYRKLTKGTNAQNLSAILENIANKQNMQGTQTAQLLSEISKLQDIQKIQFQKFAMIRFNPFEDVGGDQSFVIALLDGENSGFVLSSLHSRAGTRIYAKEVKVGKASTHQFSKEEEEVVVKAAH